MNDHQKTRLLDIVIKRMQEKELKKIAILGFAFKAGTSDTRSTSAALFCATLAMSGF